jgi:transcriptional regulator with XRE-family HTH domain
MTFTPEKHSNARVSAIRARRDPKNVSRIQKAMKLAAAIEDAMIAKGWNRSQFAREMNVMPSQITRWLSGTQGLNSDTLFDIEFVLGTSIILPKVVEVKDTHYVVVYKTITVPHHNQAVIDMDFSLLNRLPVKQKKSLYSGRNVNTDISKTGQTFYYKAQMTKQNVTN